MSQRAVARDFSSEKLNDLNPLTNSLIVLSSVVYGDNFSNN
jgi:hypothetical protein